MFGRDAGRYPDYSPDWYLDVGSLLYQTYLFVVVWPIVDAVWWWFVGKLMQLYDKAKCCCCCSDPARTKQTTLQNYIWLHGGQEFDMHNKYAQIINLIFVAFMHGMGLPLLFPLAALGIFILYIVDRLKMAYYYRQPPLYDASLNKATVYLLQYGPVLMLGFGYWQLSDRKMFANKAQEQKS